MRATSSGRWTACRPATVARATLMWLAEPSDLHSTSWMPASSRMTRAAPPAMTPVPGAAGFISKRPAPVTPRTGWVIVLPARATSKRLFFASSVPFWMASGTSFALPYPRPTRPLPSPTTTSAVNENRRPPFTTLATRLIAITRDSRRPPGSGGAAFGLLLVYENPAIRTPDLLHGRHQLPQQHDRGRRSLRGRTRPSRFQPPWRARQ